MMDKIRTLRLNAIQIPIVVEHEHMKLSEAESVGGPASRVDMLAVDIELSYRGNALAKGSHNGVFNFMALYQDLCLSPVRTLHGPLEGVIDETMNLIETTAQGNKLELVDACVTANRLGLVVGAPELKSERIYQTRPCLPVGSYRSAGITKVPLQVKVDHSWSKDAEHSGTPNPRPETVDLSFSAITPSRSLSSDSLAGLYNYLKTYKLAYAMQDVLVDGPFERLAEQILENVARDSAELQPKMLSISLMRMGYARCRPTLGLEVWL
jgi:hypothetical protein